MNEDEHEVERIKRNIEGIKLYYDDIMFGEYSYEYYKYCILSKIEYGSFFSLAHFETIISYITDPYSVILSPCYDVSDGQTEFYEHKALQLEYEEYCEYCKQKKLSTVSVVSYIRYIEEVKKDFI